MYELYADRLAIEIVPLSNDLGFEMPWALLGLLALLRLPPLPLLLAPTLLEDLVDARLNFCSHTIFGVVDEVVDSLVFILSNDYKNSVRRFTTRSRNARKKKKKKKKIKHAVSERWKKHKKLEDRSLLISTASSHLLLTNEARIGFHDRF